jgi:hypothetical protein
MEGWSEGGAMEGKKVSLCTQCGYIMRGMFCKCIRCGFRRMEYFGSYTEPELMVRMRKIQGRVEPAGTLYSLTMVGFLGLIMASVFSLLINPAYSHQLASQLAAILH